VKPPVSKAERAEERAEHRRALLDQTAVTVGRIWADQWRHDLRREGRAAAGGWPGTLREARIRVEHHLQDELARRTIAEVTGAERELLVRRAYASARAEWSSRAEPEGP
jgi:hypothetical protein